MFDFLYQAESRRSTYEERVQRGQANARREWNQENMPRPAVYRQMLARVGAALVAIGTWLQRVASPEPSTRLDPAHTR